MNERIPIEIRARIRVDGSVVPEDVIVLGVRYHITSVLKKCAVRPIGISCISALEYTVMIEGRRKKIYYEKLSGKWFSVKERNGLYEEG